MKLTRLLGAVSALFLVAVGIAAQLRPASTDDAALKALEPDFEQRVKPFLKKNCQGCHNADNMTSGVRVDHLDAGLEDRHLRLWEAVRHRISDGTMPPKGMPQPPVADRDAMKAWITRALDVARSRPSPKNGLVRRLTISQYRNTLRELLLLEDDLTEPLPPDAVSRDGFVNNKDTLQMSPLLMESYLEVAEEALTRSIVDPKEKPSIQNFRMDFGESVNSSPLQEELILGAGSLLLPNKDYLVTQLTPAKPFPYDPFFMRTKYRFIEGYKGNDTVRGWRDFDSIYHAVFADMRGSMGYPKGDAYGSVPQGFLLRPAIPNDEMFEEDGTYGPKANFKISLRELPENGRFRVTVMAAKYDDGLLLDSDSALQPPAAQGGIVRTDPKTPGTVNIPSAGIYQVDVRVPPRTDKPAPAETSRLNESLAANWTLDGTVEGEVSGAAKYVPSPFGQAISIEGGTDGVVIPRADYMNVGDGEFTVAAWIHPRQLKKAPIVSLGASGSGYGWTLEISNRRGGLRLETVAQNNIGNASVMSNTGVVRANMWQHVAAVVRRGKNETQLYVNGYLVGKGKIGSTDIDNPKATLQIGRAPYGDPLRGDVDEVRFYRRALSEGEIQGLVEPGRKFAVAPREKPHELTLEIGDRRFTGVLEQPAFLALRLPAGPVAMSLKSTGVRDPESVIFTPIAAGSAAAKQFLTFEKRTPRLGVHLGLRRDCGSTFAPVGEPQTVAGTKLQRYTFEGAIRNYPSPEVEKDNVNYLAGVKEIAVRSEYTDDRDMPRLLIRSVEFEGPLYESWPPATHRNIFVSSAAKPESPEYAREVIRRFATRAYRRPLTATEESGLVSVFQKSQASGRGFRDSVKDALQVALTSPQFLFLVETSATPAPEPLDNYELASKLSYFLWNGPPDAATLRLAAGNGLRPALNAEIDRMIASPKFSRFTREFVAQWLSLEKFQVLEPDRKRFPKLNRDTRTHLRQEPIEFVQYLMRNNLPVKNVVSSDFVLADETVATYYGFGDKTEAGFKFLAIPHGRRELGGLLTQPALLAGLSDGRESNPVKRGAWLARKIIAEPPDDPPPNVPALKEEAGNLTLRQRLEQHRNQPGCMQCHQKIDPWGVALEQYDAGGMWKQQPADAGSTLPDGTEVKGIDDLRRYLSEDRIDQVAFSVLKHLSIYANGRNLTYYEQNLLKKDALQLKAGGYKMKDMIHFVANSKMFLEK